MAETTECATCHIEHRGLNASLRPVDDRECATCHNFATLARHPEFAAVRAQATPGVGIKFDHDGTSSRRRRRAARPARCATSRPPNASGFAPMSFDRHCARATCRRAVRGDRPDPAGELWFRRRSCRRRGDAATAVDVQARGRKQVASGSRHRDSWMHLQRAAPSPRRSIAMAKRRSAGAACAALPICSSSRTCGRCTRRRRKNSRRRRRQLQREIATIEPALAAVRRAGSRRDSRERSTAAQTVAKLVAANRDGAKDRCARRTGRRRWHDAEAAPARRRGAGPVRAPQGRVHEAARTSITARAADDGAQDSAPPS